MVKKLLLLASVSYTIVLIVVSFINLHSVPKLGSSFDDKVYHLLAYLLLAFFWVIYFRLLNKNYSSLTPFISVLLFGTIIESLQHQLNPNRTFDVYDILANCIGTILGTLIALRLNIIKLK